MSLMIFMRLGKRMRGKRGIFPCVVHVTYNVLARNVEIKIFTSIN